MLISEGIAGKRFLKFGSIVKLLRVEKEWNGGEMQNDVITCPGLEFLQVIDIL